MKYVIKIYDQSIKSCIKICFKINTVRNIKWSLSTDLMTGEVRCFKFEYFPFVTSVICSEKKSVRCVL